MAVRHVEGSTHGYLLLETLDGKTVAMGDLVEVVRAKDVVTRLTFHFHDGSIDDDTTVFTQHGRFRLISDHHIQKGPFFPKQTDTLVEANGKVTTRTVDEKGKEKVTEEHMDLPPDLYNGLIATAVVNQPANAGETKIAMVVGGGKPSLIHLAIHPDGEEAYTVGGIRRMAKKYRLHIDLGGVKQVIAPIVGKQPDDILIWVSGGESPAVIREEGQTFMDGPVLRMVQVRPVFPELEHAGRK